MGQEKYANGFKLTEHPQVVADPLKMEKAANDLCEFDERSFSSRCFGWNLFKSVFTGDAEEAHWAKFQGAHQNAQNVSAELNPDLDGADNYLDWGVRLRNIRDYNLSGLVIWRKTERRKYKIRV